MEKADPSITAEAFELFLCYEVQLDSGKWGNF